MSMTAPWLLAYQGMASVNLKSEAELRFVSAVIGSFSRRAFTLYLVGGPEMRPLTAIFLSALNATGRLHGGSDDLVRTFRLRSGGTARHIELSTTQHGDDQVIAKINELIAEKVFLIVEGADRLPLPNPDFSLELRAHQRQPRQRAYICSLVIRNYTIGTIGLSTCLAQPMWWSLHPAYAELRAQRKR
jgi:hypothetical protein